MRNPESRWYAKSHRPLQATLNTRTDSLSSIPGLYEIGL
jgi:hypothetical protein